VRGGGGRGGNGGSTGLLELDSVGEGRVRPKLLLTPAEKKRVHWNSSNGSRL
jgi:hypothetical protein